MNTSQKIGNRATNDWKRNWQSKTTGGAFDNSLDNWQQVRNMTLYERSISERQSLSDVTMGRGSPICGKSRIKIVEQFQKNVPQCKIAKTSKSLHPQYIISSKDSENQEESLCARDKAEGQNFMLVIFEPSGSTVLKTGMILYWTSLHGLRNFSTIHCLWTQFHKCKLMMYHVKTKPYVNTIQKRRCLLCAEKYIEVSEQHMLPYRQRLCKRRLCIIQQDNAKSRTASIATTWARRRGVQVLNRPACGPDRSPIENIWCIINKKSGNGPGLLGS